MGFSIDNSIFFQKFKDTQPKSALNPKIARYFPDGQRVFSFDYLVGMGVWPGLNNTLLYLENYPIYDLISNANGTQLIGQVWQNIKVVDLMITCDDGSKGGQCSCASGMYWDFGSYQCKPLACTAFSNGMNAN